MWECGIDNRSNTHARLRILGLNVSDRIVRFVNFVRSLRISKCCRAAGQHRRFETNKHGLDLARNACRGCSHHRFSQIMARPLHRGGVHPSCRQRPEPSRVRDQGARSEVWTRAITSRMKGIRGVDTSNHIENERGPVRVLDPCAGNQRTVSFLTCKRPVDVSQR